MPVARTYPAIFAVGLGLATIASCGGGDTQAPAVATTIAASSSTSLSAIAGGAVSERPAVVVKDQNGSAMPGVAVAFAVTGGGGSLTGASLITDANGIATVGGWTLGTTAGANTMTATAASLPAVTFTATGTAGPAASIAKTSGDNQSAIAGAAVATAPSVTVKDANGNSVSGAAVTFTVASGGGSVTGPSQTTNSSGVATVGGWTLGAGGGTNTLTAASGTLSATFTATGTVTITLEKTSGDNQSTLAGDPVTAPSVTVKRNGSALANATVTFTAGSSGGTVTGGTQSTSSAGVATVGKWRIGPVGTSTLAASTAGATSVSFTATAVDPCLNGYDLAIGVSQTWDIHNLDCLLDDGRRADSWLMTLTSGTFQFTQTSSEVGVALDLWVNSNPAPFVAVYSAASFNTASTTFKAIVPAGNYYVRAMNGASGQTGNYTLSYSAVSAGITNCDYVFIMKGVTTSQTTASTDCKDSNGFFEDAYWIWVEPNVSVTVTMSSTAVNSYLLAFTQAGTEVARNDNKTTSTNDAEITFTAPAGGGFFKILATTATPGSSGAYTLTVK